MLQLHRSQPWWDIFGRWLQLCVAWLCPFSLLLWDYAFAIVIFIQQIFIDQKHGTELGTELGTEDRDSNNSNPGTEFTLCQICS